MALAAIHHGVAAVSALFVPASLPFPSGLKPSTKRLPLNLPHGQKLHHVHPLLLPTVRLSGTVQGTLSQGPSNPDRGPDDTFQGSGRVAPLGKVQLTATLYGTDSSGGLSGGSLELTGATGGLFLWLEGNFQHAAMPPQPGTYSFTVKSGTGRFARKSIYGPFESGCGTAKLTIGTGTFRLIFHPHTGPGLC